MQTDRCYDAPLVEKAGGMTWLLSNLSQVWRNLAYAKNSADHPLSNVPLVPGYPILGILPSMCTGLYSTTMTQLFEAAHDAGISRAYAGMVPIIYLRDPTVIRQVFVHNSDAITRFGADGTGPFNIMHRMTGNVTVTADGADWQRWRKGLLKGFSNSQTLKSAYDGIQGIARKHIEKMQAEKGGPDLLRSMEAYALDTVWYVTLGVNNISDCSEELLSVMYRYVRTVGNVSHLWRHALRNLLSWKSFQEPDHVEQGIRDQIDSYLGKLLTRNSRNINPDTPPESSDRDCFLRQVSKESGGYQGNPITDDVLVQARQVFSLGHEASTLILVWAMYELNFHPEVVAKLRDEFRERCCDYDNLDFDTVRTMPYLEAVVTELFRLHPPISTTARMSTRPITVVTRAGDSVTIPQHSQLFTSVHLLHHDKQVWGPDADEFNPERWLDCRGNVKQNLCEYLPFLAGPRGCPCAPFVSMQLKTMLVLLLKWEIHCPELSHIEKLIAGVVAPSAPIPYEVFEAPTTPKSSLTPYEICV